MHRRRNLQIMVLNICTNDYANFMHDITKAMRAVQIETTEMKKHPHEFGYESETPIRSHREFITEIAKADLVQIFHSDINTYNLVKQIAPTKELIMYHTGTLYRQKSNYYNQQIDRKTKIVHALGEFMTLGANNPTYLVGAIDCNKITPEDINKVETRRPIFGHYPSNKTNKGTVLIKNLMEKHPNTDFQVSGTLLPHPDHLNRMRKVDVVIELFSPSQLGKKYGSFGMTALEAAAMGKIVMTQNLSNPVYLDHYGSHPLQLINNPVEWRQTIERLEEMTPQERNELKQQTWKWVIEKHSHRATGQYIKDHIL